MPWHVNWAYILLLLSVFYSRWVDNYGFVQLSWIFCCGSLFLQTLSQYRSWNSCCLCVVQCFQWLIRMNCEFAFDLCSTHGKKETGQGGSLAFGNLSQFSAFGGILRQVMGLVFIQLNWTNKCAVNRICRLPAWTSWQAEKTYEHRLLGYILFQTWNFRIIKK